MTNVVSTLRDRLAKRARYYRIVRDLRAMPLDVALDLDIYREDADRIARTAVYGA